MTPGIVEATPTTPRGAVYLYLVASRDGDFETAASFLDLSEIEAEQRAVLGPRLAPQLKIVLDQSLWIDFAELSGLPGGDVGDGLADGRDRVGVIRSERGDVSLLVERKGEQWRFASGVVARIPSLFSPLGADHQPVPSRSR